VVVDTLVSMIEESEVVESWNLLVRKLSGIVLRVIVVKLRW
ncbi:hypothetical protein Tco_0942386, partial [Tanacetum coccineum]